jgi:hypothetical protein
MKILSTLLAFLLAVAPVSAFDSTAPGGGLSDVVSDTTPQLGGNLDGQTFNITTTGTGSFEAVHSSGNLTGAFLYGDGSNLSGLSSAEGNTFTSSKTFTNDVQVNGTLNTSAPATTAQEVNIGGALSIQGPGSGGTWSAMVAEYQGGNNGRIIVRGSDASTVGTFTLILEESDSGGSVTPLSVSAAGVTTLTDLAVTNPVATWNVGSPTYTAQKINVGGGISADGAGAGGTWSAVVMEYAGGNTGRHIIRGPDAGTRASYDMLMEEADGGDSLTIFSVEVNGNVGINETNSDATLEVHSRAAPDDYVINISSTDGNSMWAVRGNGHVVSAAGQPDPTLSSCGTSPSIVGSDTAGKVTIGSSASGTCTVTFDEEYATAPACILTNGTIDVPVWATTTTSALTITDGAGDFSDDVIMYHCIGL